MVATESILDDPLFKASEYRADGYTWETAAQKLGMSADELRLLTLQIGSGLAVKRAILIDGMHNGPRNREE